MSQILSMLAFVIVMVIGGGLMLFFILSFPIMIIWKFYRYFKYGEKFMD